MKIGSIVLAMLLFCGSVYARKPLSERTRIYFKEAVTYELPVDTCELSVSMFFNHDLVRSRETLSVKFYLVSEDGTLSKPITMLIQGNAASRQDARKLRRAGQPVPARTSAKARKKEVYSLVYTRLIPGKQPWMDKAPLLKIEQTFSCGRTTEALPERIIPLRHVEGRNANS